MGKNNEKKKPVPKIWWLGEDEENNFSKTIEVLKSASSKNLSKDNTGSISDNNGGRIILGKEFINKRKS